MQELRCVLYDYDALDKDDEIGEAKIAIKDLKNQEEKDVWLDIHETQDKHPSNHKVCWHSHLRKAHQSSALFTGLQVFNSYLELGWKCCLTFRCMHWQALPAAEQGKESELVAASLCVQGAMRKLTLLKVKAEDGVDKIRQQRAHSSIAVSCHS